MLSFRSVQKTINLCVIFTLLFNLNPPTSWAAGVFESTDAQTQLPQADIRASSRAVTEASPLSITRQQSTYQADGSLVVTYVVQNDAPPTVQPDLTGGATVTDTIDAILGTDFASDPNTVRDVVLSDDLNGAGVAFIAAQPHADRDGTVVAINLGDIPPLGSATAVVTLTIPSSAGDFVTLDAGATAQGNWRGRLASADSLPLTLAPDSFDQWLVCTIDANCEDAYVLEKSAELQADPTAIFEYVRDLTYETYDGSLRGARGTLWSEAGNGIDQASLLVALLRASGIPAAYHQGTLSTPNAATLIDSMFTNPNTLGGYIPAGTPVADPSGDPELLADAQNHAWVEAYLPTTGWTMFDPSFPTANAGDTFATSSSGRIAELPDNVRHKVTMAVTVEKYSEFPIGGVGLFQIEPLAATFSTVELIGEPVVFSHVVESAGSGGLVFVNVQHTYTPYFVVGDGDPINGTPFDDLITSFPLATNFVLAEWLDITLTEPDGTTETHRRELFDDLGVDVRAGGGAVTNLGRDETPRLSIISSWNTLFAPSDISLDAVNAAYQEAITLAQIGAEIKQEAANYSDTDNPSPEQTEFANEAARQIGRITQLAQRMHLLEFAASSDAAHDYVADATYVKAYPAVPRVFTVGWERNPQTNADSIDFDMQRNQVRSVPYPGQTDTGHDAFRFTYPLLDMALETQVLEKVTETPIVSVSNVFAAANDNNVEIVRITLGNLEDLDGLPLSAEAKARITANLQAQPDSFILVPEEMILLPDATEPTVGWLQIDNETLAVTDMMEDGTHGAIGYANLAKFSKKVGSLIGGFSAGFFATTIGFWGGFFGAVPITDLGAALKAGKDAAKEMGDQAKKACKRIGDKKWCKAGASAGIAAGEAAISKADPPVTAQLYASPFDPPVTENTATAIVAHSADLAGSITANVTTDLLATNADSAWSTDGANSFAFDFLQITASDVTQNGLSIGSGIVSGTVGTLDSDGALLTVALTGDGSAALSGDLFAGSQRDDYAATLTPSGSVDVLLTDATIVVDSMTYSGDFVVTTSDPISLSGDGATAAPNFTSGATLSGSNYDLSAGVATGTLTVGGTPVDPANGFALGNLNSAATVSGGVDLTLSDSADFFALALTNPASTTAADTATTFSADLTANFTDSYTMTVFAPDGWDVTLDTAGNISALPALGVAAGDHAIIVTVQSADYPELFVSAEHTVTVTPVDGVELDIEPDPQFTLPWGTDYPVTNLNINGQFQLPDAAYTVAVTNTSNVERTFDLTVSGALPTAWTIFGAEAGNTTNTITLAAGQRVDLSLYALPTVGDLLPIVGNSYAFDVTAVAQDNASVNAADSDTFTVAATPYPAIAVEPDEMFVLPNSTNEFTATLTNIGTASGTFDWQTLVPKANWSATTPAPVTLAPGASSVATISYDVTTGTAGIDHPVSVAIPAPTLPYTPTQAVDVYIASVGAAPIAGATTTIESCSADPVLAAYFFTIATSVSTLESACSSGNCNSQQRDNVVNSVNALVGYLNSDFPTVDTSAATAAANALAPADTVQENLDAIPAIASSVSDLAAPVCEIAERIPALSWSPGYNAALVSESVTYTLALENRGTLDTTYDLTVTLPSGVQTASPTVPAGDSTTFDYVVSSASTGQFTLSAAATAQDAPDIGDSESALLRVVDQFFQIVAVTPDPAFVESGVSSTDISIDVANFAFVAREGSADVAIIAPSGAISHTQNVPLSLSGNDLTTYDLSTLDTSGYATGVYTVSVELRDLQGGLLSDGYGLLAVGVGINANASTSPAIVAPGTVTVSTAITTAVTSQPFGGVGGRGVDSAEWQPTDLQPLPAGFREELVSDDGSIIVRESSEQADLQSDAVNSDPIDILPTENESIVTDDQSEISHGDRSANRNPISQTPSAASPITRTENTDPAITYTGTWSEISNSFASSGNHQRGTDGSASFTFNGDWVGVGLVAGTRSGIADIYIDGALQETVDLYRHDETHVSRYFTLPVSATHTISVSVTGNSHPNASVGARVNIDFFDTWDGTAIPDETFEQDNGRVWLSNSWLNSNNATASGGSYLRGAGNAWIPFTGDSISYQMIEYSSGGKVRLSVDGAYITTLDLFNYAIMTETLSFDGFGAGAHVLHIDSYQGNGTLDAFAQPGTAPFFSTSAESGITRYEEDHPAILYNGEPFTQTTSTWTAINYGSASKNYYARTETTNDTVSFTFEGAWAGIGFVAGTSAGEAEIFIDGVSQGVIDLYRWEEDAVSRYFDLGSTGTHTLTVVALGSRNDFSSRNRVNIDFIDVWDGVNAENATGTFEAQSDVLVAEGFGQISTAVASDGTYLRGGGNAWFPFTGDSFSFDAIGVSSGGEMKLFIDGEFVREIDLYSPVTEIRTYSFDNLGAGAHVAYLSSYRDNASIDTFTTPGVAPFYTPPVESGIIHREEDHPDIRYNGAPYTATATSWVLSSWNEASDTYTMRSETLSDTISLDFYGSWLAVGMMSWSGGGMAEIFIDGVSQGIVDGYSPSNETIDLIYDLPLDNHTLEIVVLAQQNPSSSNDRIYLDYIDTWDGTDEPDGWYELDRTVQSDRVSYSANWSIDSTSSLAREGEFWADGSNVWFRFTGEAFTLRAMSDANDEAALEVFIDGVSQGVFSTNYERTRSPLPFHFDGLSDGAHIVRVQNITQNGQTRADIDAFEANPTVLDVGVPMVEWEEIDVTGAILNTVMAADVDEDGIIEIVATANDGNLIIYRGDGAEATGPQAVAGTPIEFMLDLGGEPDSVALADLDGVAGSEIAVGFPQGFAVYTLDSGNWVEQWFTDTVRSTWRAPAIGNVDSDPEPEIITTGASGIYVLEGDGSGLTELTRSNYPTLPSNLSNPLPPNLADLTGDGRLDVLSGDGDFLFVFDMATNPPTLAWTAHYTDDLGAARGTPAIGDMDLDGTPEIAFVTSQNVVLVNGEDGSIVWQYPTGGGAAGGVSIADMTGDGIPEIVASAQVNGGQIYALDADGNLIWMQPALDNTSANAVSLLDLDGNGIWDVVWNGAGTGLTVWRGNDGAVLYNEPTINSTTRMDFPTIVDVDGDGSAEIITNDDEGIFVVGYDSVWANSRTIWNEYNYHITNIQDNLSVPISELDSWTTHNTYRTQTPLGDVLPVYDVVVTHTVPAMGVQVITDTATIPFDVDGNPFAWSYEQPYYEQIKANRFDVVLTDMQAGEVRQVSTQTVIEYTLPSGSNRVTLPPMFVQAAHLIALEPFSQTVGAGAAAVYTVTLTNPTDSLATYSLEFPSFANLENLVDVPANSSVAVPLTIATTDEMVGVSDFAVAVDGGVDSTAGRLIVVDAFDVSIAPGLISADAGEVTTYTLTITNNLPTPQTIDLSVDGLPSVNVPVSVALASAGSAGDVVTVDVTAQGFAAGRLPFTVTGTNADGATDEAAAVLEVAGQDVIVALNPDPAQANIGAPTVVEVTVTNIGLVDTTYDLSVDVPSGWSAELAETTITLPPSIFNSRSVQLLITPPAGTVPDDYAYTVTAAARQAGRAFDEPAVAAAQGIVQVSNRGVQVSIDPVSRLALPTDMPTWNVTITNTGSIAETFVLTSTGIVALSAQWSQDSVNLAAGASTTVQLTATDLTLALPQTYLFAVAAIADDDPTVLNEAQATITFPNLEDVVVEWSPDVQTIRQGETINYVLTISNTGNAVTIYDLAYAAMSVGIALRGDTDRVTVPAHSAVTVIVEATGLSQGIYTFEGSAEGTTAQDSDSADLIVQGPLAITLNQFTTHFAWWQPGVILLGLLLSLWWWRRTQYRH